MVLKRRIVPTGEPWNTETVPHGSVGGRGKRSTLPRPRPTQSQPYPVKPVRMVVMKWTRPCADYCHRGLDTLYAATGQWEQARTDRG